MLSKKKNIIAGLIPLAVAIAIALGLTLVLTKFQKERELEWAQIAAEELVRAQQAQAEFAKLSPSDALQLCRQSWESKLSLSGR